MMTLNSYTRRHKITMTAAPATANPHMPDMPAGSSHYKVTLKHGRNHLTTHFSMGPAHTQEPTVEEVLSCLADDASGYENEPSFADWAASYGYDDDSITALKIFKAVQLQSQKLRAWLGHDLTAELLYNTERL